MFEVIKYNSVPEGSIICRKHEKIDYCDSFQIVTNTHEGIDIIATRIFKVKGWVRILFKIRNNMVRPFGLKTAEIKTTRESDYYPVGSRAIYFTVVDRNSNEIVLAENDKHLNFRASVMKVNHEDYSSIYLTTIVAYNNVWGKLYFMTVRPFHKMIMKSLLKKFHTD